MVSLGNLADSWSSIYSHSALIKSTVGFAHVGGLVAGGGCAIAADRATLSAWRRGADALRDEAARLHRTHAVVVAGLVFVTISGVLLMFADLDSYLHATVFWIKMGLVAALLANGVVLLRSGRAAADGHARAGRLVALSAFTSLTLWFATTLAGAVLPNAL